MSAKQKVHSSIKVELLDSSHRTAIMTNDGNIYYQSMLCLTHVHPSIYACIHMVSHGYSSFPSLFAGNTHYTSQYGLSERSFPLLITRVEARDLKNVEIIGI